MDKIKVMSVFGTRPEAVKMAPLIKELETDHSFDSFVCVTAQHRDMLDQVLSIFNIKPDADLNIMLSGQSLTDITVRALKGLEDIIRKICPDIILVHGDTTTAFTAALAAYYCKIPVGHVEAGLRTYDKYQPYPEEMNRRLAGALADLHFAPTLQSKENLLKENVNHKHIFVTGNTAIDCLKTTLQEKYIFTNDVLNTIDYANKRVITMTAHRRENLGKPMENILSGIMDIVHGYEDVEVVYPVHLNPLVQETAQRIMAGHERVHLIDPIDLCDIHNLMNRSYMVMSDSGGLQEEVPYMNKPVLVLRNVTERPEGIAAGTLKLAGTDREQIFQLGSLYLDNQMEYDKMARAVNPFGDGHASQRIAASIKYYFGLSNIRPAEYGAD